MKNNENLQFSMNGNQFNFISTVGRKKTYTNQADTNNTHYNDHLVFCFLFFMTAHVIFLKLVPFVSTII